MRETIIAAALLALTALPAAADVTSQESIAVDAAGFIKASGSTTELTTGDKQRRDTEFHCQGFMSLLCGNARSGEIVRLDRNLSWQLQPNKKIYTETEFPTPEERAQAQQKMQETLDKMKQCQQQSQAKRQTQNKGDTSDCDLSPPKLDVRQTEERATVAGFDTRKASVKLSQTCTDRKTGDVCEFVYGFDMWMSPEQPPGYSDRQAFQKAYLSKLGLDPNTPAFKGMLQTVMAQYAGTMKEMADKASAIRGYPLRTTFRLIIGGDKCSKSRQSSSDDNSNSGGGGGLSGLAANAGGKLLSGLLSKRNSGGDASQSAASANAAPTLPDGYFQVIAFTTETTSIATGSISPDQFEVPAGWTLEKPKPNKSSEYTCPTEDK